MKNRDKELILNSILKASFIMILISVILKLFGLNIFNLDVENKIVNYFANTLLKLKLLDYLFGFIFMFIDFFIILKFSAKNSNSKTYYLGALNLVLLNFSAQYFIFSKLGYDFYPLYSIFIVIIISSIVNKKFILLRPFIVTAVISIYQLISLFLRNITFNEQFELMYEFLLNFDYMILMIITYYLYLKKGSEFKWNYSKNYLAQVDSDGAQSSSDLKTTLSKLQQKYHLFLNSKRNEKAFVIIYLILVFISEVFNIGIIIFVAFLNNSVIECLFILTSFLITKKVFGKPFHFNSAFKCFIVSNLAYYVLNRITFSIGISFVIPISLGVLLSYITSLFVKKTEVIKMFRGMNPDDLKYICINNNLNSFETDLLIDFYCYKMTLVKLSIKYNYSKDAIWKKKKIALQKIKEQ